MLCLCGVTRIVCKSQVRVVVIDMIIGFVWFLFVGINRSVVLAVM